MRKALIFDGNSIVNRAFYAIKALTNSKGFYTNGIHGFMNIFLKFVEEEKPDLGYNENTPDHLKLLFQLIKQNKDETKIFNDAFPKIIEVKSTKELFIKMLNEK